MTSTLENYWKDLKANATTYNWRNTVYDGNHCKINLSRGIEITPGFNSHQLNIIDKTDNNIFVNLQFSPDINISPNVKSKIEKFIIDNLTKYELSKFDFTVTNNKYTKFFIAKAINLDNKEILNAGEHKIWHTQMIKIMHEAYKSIENSL